LRFEWDPVKATANFRKHGVRFDEAPGVIRHSLAITVDDLSHSEVEQREKTIGFSARGRVLVVVHTKPRANVSRIISVRKAGRRELVDYEKEIKQRLKES